ALIVRNLAAGDAADEGADDGARALAAARGVAVGDAVGLLGCGGGRQRHRSQTAQQGSGGDGGGDLVARHGSSPVIELVVGRDNARPDMKAPGGASLYSVQLDYRTNAGRRLRPPPDALRRRPRSAGWSAAGRRWPRTSRSVGPGRPPAGLRTEPRTMPAAVRR